MVLTVSHIPHEGLNVPLSLEQEWTQKAIKEAFDGEVTEFGGQLHITAEGTRVCVSCELHATVVLPCSRCLCDLCVSIQGDDQLFYDPDVSSGKAITSKKQLEKIKEEIELSADELDLGWYTHDRLALQDVLCEALILLCPPRIHCKMEGVTRQKEGECREYKGDDEPITYNPFANLDVL